MVLPLSPPYKVEGPPIFVPVQPGGKGVPLSVFISCKFFHVDHYEEKSSSPPFALLLNQD